MNVVNRPSDIAPKDLGGNPLKRLEAFGQSPWLDFIQRSFIGPKLQELVDRDGLKGITSNPAIFEKAMGHGTDYDEGFKKLAAKRRHGRARHLRSLRRRGHPGTPATSCAPSTTPPTRSTATSASKSPPTSRSAPKTPSSKPGACGNGSTDPTSWSKSPAPKPASPPSAPSSPRGSTSTSPCSSPRAPTKPSPNPSSPASKPATPRVTSVADIASVASFFVSRIDAQIDKKIDDRLKQGHTGLAELRGKVAIANAKMAYQHYLGLVASPRWQKLAAAGAQPQRLLWASTGVKDKAYSDVLYVEELIGRDTVNTIPPATMDAFRDHGKLRESLTEDVEGARHILAEAEKAGLDLAGVTKALVTNGVELFAEAADNLLGAVAAKRAAMLGDKLAKVSAKLPELIQKSVDDAATEWRTVRQAPRPLGRRSQDLDRRRRKPLARLAPRRRRRHARNSPSSKPSSRKSKPPASTDALLLGMGGSSLGPEVLAETFGKQPGFPTPAHPRQHRPGADPRPPRQGRPEEDPLHRQQQIRQHPRAQHLQSLFLGRDEEGRRRQGRRTLRRRHRPRLQDAASRRDPTASSTSSSATRPSAAATPSCPTSAWSPPPPWASTSKPSSTPPR